MGIFGKPAARPRTKQVMSGPLHAVPCPHCAQPNDCRGLAPVGETGGWGAYGLEPGTTLSCDHCKRPFRITGVQTVTVVSVRQA